MACHTARSSLLRRRQRGDGAGAHVRAGQAQQQAGRLSAAARGRHMQRGAAVGVADAQVHPVLRQHLRRRHKSHNHPALPQRTWPRCRAGLSGRCQAGAQARINASSLWRPRQRARVPARPPSCAADVRQGRGRTLSVSRSLAAAAKHRRSALSAAPRRPPAPRSAACSSRRPQRTASASGVAPALSSALTSTPCARVRRAGHGRLAAAPAQTVVLVESCPGQLLESCPGPAVTRGRCVASAGASAPANTGARERCACA
jgi:hypothetical protein